MLRLELKRFKHEEDEGNEEIEEAEAGQVDCHFL